MEADEKKIHDTDDPNQGPGTLGETTGPGAPEPAPSDPQGGEGDNDPGETTGPGH